MSRRTPTTVLASIAVLASVAPASAASPPADSVARPFVSTLNAAVAKDPVPSALFEYQISSSLASALGEIAASRYFIVTKVSATSFSVRNELNSPATSETFRIRNGKLSW